MVAYSFWRGLHRQGYNALARAGFFQLTSTPFANGSRRSGKIMNLLRRRLPLLCLLLAVSLGRAQADDPGPAPFDPQPVAAKVVELLAAGKQSEAEGLLDESLRKLPEARHFATLVSGRRNSINAAWAYHRENQEKIRAAQRLFYLFGVVTRSRFDIPAARIIFQAASRMDSKTPAANCAIAL